VKRVRNNFSYTAPSNADETVKKHVSAAHWLTVTKQNASADEVGNKTTG
jgi:hypothetical protein